MDCNREYEWVTAHDDWVGTFADRHYLMGPNPHKLRWRRGW